MTSLQHINSIGLFGFGAFGQLVARHIPAKMPMTVFDPALRATDTFPRGVRSGSLQETAGCQLVILAVPVKAMSSLCDAISPHLPPGAIVADVASVKVEPCRVMQERLPAHVDIVGTHPLFGPQSAASGVAGHKIAICNIRGRSHLPLSAFLCKVLALNVILTSAEEHDRELATVQGLTHLIARTLADMAPLPARMTTTSFLRKARAHASSSDE